MVFVCTYLIHRCLIMAIYKQRSCDNGHLSISIRDVRDEGGVNSLPLQKMRKCKKIDAENNSSCML